MGDGGKWVCGLSRIVESSRAKPCVIYSFGVRDESSFENEILSRTNCEVWAYDFSVVDFGVQLEPANRDRASFMQAGIAGKTDTARDPPFYSIRDLMKMNGHEYMCVASPFPLSRSQDFSCQGHARLLPSREGDKQAGDEHARIRGHLLTRGSYSATAIS